jgi:SAM-dependent methyltransferase
MIDFEKYFKHLNQISPLGRLYKRYVSSQILYYQASRFGKNIAEIGCGTGNGILGAYSSHVVGYEINPLAVEFCKSKNLNVNLIDVDKVYPVKDGEYSACVLDNVLEHLEDPSFVLSECARITRTGGGLIIAVPGDKGYVHDDDHKIHYSEDKLKNLSEDWHLIKIFSIPFLIKSVFLSKTISQYCLVAVYHKLSK